jgi:hypothetical protein
MITRPDLGQQFELNLDASQYSQMPYPFVPKMQKGPISRQPLW